MKSLFLGILILCTNWVSAQNVITLSGIVTNLKKENIGYAGIGIFQESTLVKGVLTDSLGYFSTPLTQGKYLLKVSALGYKIYEISIEIAKNKDISILLEEESNRLSEISIISRKPLVEKKIDRLVFNVGSSVFLMGNNIEDILKKTPMLRVDDNGITIRGSQGAIVYIDDVKINLSGIDLMSFLKLMPADNIEKVEVLTNPPSKYDAGSNAGIINIILKKKSEIGLQGSMQVAYIQTFFAKYNPSINLNYRSLKWNIYGNGSYKNGNYYGIENYDQQFTQTAYSEYFKKYKERIESTAMIGIEYRPNSNQSIGLLIEGALTNSKGRNPQYARYFRKTEIDSTFNGLENTESEQNIVSYNLNYQNKIDTMGKNIRVDIDYIYFQVPYQKISNTSNISLGNQYVFDRTIQFKTNIKRDIKVASAKIDYTHPFKNGILEFGMKISQTQTYNQSMFENIINIQPNEDIDKSNEFSYKENNNASYVSYSASFGRFDLKAGLRGEWTHSRGLSPNKELIDLNYFKLFPTLFFQHNINEILNYGISYSRRIERPAYDELNPLRSYVNPYSYYIGNPLLKPAFINAIELNVSFKSSYFFSAFYRQTDGYFTQIFLPNTEKNYYIFGYQNFEKQLSYGVSLYSMLKPVGIWESNNYIEYNLNNAKLIYLGSYAQNNGYNFVLNSMNNFKISSKNNLTADLSITYSPSGSTQGIFKLGSYFVVDLGIKKQIFKKQGMLSLVVTDIFNGSYVQITTDYTGIQSHSYGFLDKQGFKLYFSYNFGNSILKKSRNNDELEEKSRVK